LIECLRSLKAWAGGPSYDVITERINATWVAAGRPVAELARRGTVVDCFKPSRRRLNGDLFIAVVQALHADPGYVAHWLQALRVVLGETQAAAQVRVQDRLPDDLVEFTGRAAELARLGQALRSGRDGGRAVVISAIAGMAGVGKTRLALRAGHLLAGEQSFDHVLFVNLRGFHPDPAQPPADPAAVLDGFLRLLGVPGQQIPHDLAQRTGLYRRRLAGRRALVVLDNAASEDQVRPLLPDSPGCFALVTSRRRLAGLRSAAHVTVDVFAADEAVDFLTRAMPDVPIGPDPNALERVARRCGHLPLALGLLAAQMRAKPGWTLTDHADRLDERHQRGRIDDAVELALSLSYQQLLADRQRLLRLLALHPGSDFDAYAAAALAGTDLDTASAHLDHLCDDHLLQTTAPGRYVFHDLVRAYAGDRATDEDPPPERRHALIRLFDHCLHTAALAMELLVPADRHRRLGIAQPKTPTPPLNGSDAALAWLDTERTNLVAVVAQAASAGCPLHTTRLATTLGYYLDSAGHFADGLLVHTYAEQAADRMGDRRAQADALISRGVVHGRMGRHVQAVDHHRRALALYREVGDRGGEARALGNLGTDYWNLSRYRQAADHHRQALSAFREIGNRVGEAQAMDNLGLVCWRLGDHRQAADHYQKALEGFRAIGDRFGEARVLINLGLVHERLGDYRSAADHHQPALVLSREIGDRSLEADAVNSLGLVYTRLGDYRRAADHHRAALAQYREMNHLSAVADALNSLGEALHGDRHYESAGEQHTDALTLAEQTGERYEQARAHNGLAHVHHASGDADRARHHWHQALTHYTELDVPEADEVRAHLAELHP
jgi:tetratricopeptide (TPR) repeat protein